MAGEHTFYLTVGQTWPLLEEQLVDDNGTPIDVTGATVTLKITDLDGTGDWTLANTPAVVDGTGGWVSYTFAAADTAGKDGTYYREWKVVGAAFAGTAFVPSSADDAPDYKVVVRPAS